MKNLVFMVVSIREPDRLSCQNHSFKELCRCRHCKMRELEFAYRSCTVFRQGEITLQFLTIFLRNYALILPKKFNIAASHICIALHNGSIQLFTGVRRKIIIAITEHHVRCRCQFKSCIASGGKTSILLVKNLYARITRGIFVTDCRATIGRTVIDNDYLYCTQGLTQNRIHTLSKIFFNFIDRHYHRHMWMSILNTT